MVVPHVHLIHAMRQAEVVVRVPLPIINNVAAEFLHHLLQGTTHVSVGVGLRLEAEVGSVLSARRICGISNSFGDLVLGLLLVLFELPS